MAGERGNDPINTRKDFRFKTTFDEYFEQGVIQIRPIRPDTEYTNDPNKVGAQKRDPVTGLLMWRMAVMDPNEPNPRRASYDVILLADTEPVPTTEEIRPGLRPVVLEGVTVQPRIAGQNEFKYLDKTVRATGFAPAPGTGGRSGGAAAGPASGKNAG
ncbi:hypothetical protein [Nocardia mexicana]|uniref:Uncharacterized protein n=1 Tax=Nocardia mexicana TaxID=279262 RepID=A0A370GJ85_9NOCA|nr:hypothetical protein [Nocardia mexicana]RDI43862.1 hypothetical protein DFR68_11842 [Nocardia mexicana]